MKRVVFAFALLFMLLAVAGCSDSDSSRESDCTDCPLTAGSAELVITPDSSLETTEDGTPLTVEVALSAQPDGEVLTAVSVDDDSEAEVSPDKLAFSSLDWNIPQEVTITGKDDLEADGDTTYHLVFGPTNSTDERFNALDDVELTVTSIDGVCGNDVVDGAEACEPSGNPQTQCDYGERECTYCTQACALEQGEVVGYCGDDVVQSSEGEQCEGTRESCDYGQMSCETCDDCQIVSGEVTGYCGDGRLQADHEEECDPASAACCNQDCTQANDCQTPCLIISEYVESTHMDKALELYSCETTADISLDGIKVCTVNNSDTTCSSYHSLSGTLAPGEVLTICNDAVDSIPASKCDEMESYVTEFNGNDRILVYSDRNGNNAYDGNDQVLDAFGEIDTDPGELWSEKNYSRCDFTPYNGHGPFDVSTYYEELDCSLNWECTAGDIHAGLGVAPTEPCD